jgi:hypothetical protein
VKIFNPWAKETSLPFGWNGNGEDNSNMSWWLFVQAEPAYRRRLEGCNENLANPPCKSNIPSFMNTIFKLIGAWRTFI